MKKILVVVDMQKDFIDGALGTPEAVSVFPRVIEKIDSMELGEAVRLWSEEEDIEDITLVGLCTDICVISNALILKAAVPEIPIIVDSMCCAGVTQKSHENALEAMKMCQIKIV